MCVRAKECLSTKSSEMEGYWDMKRNIKKGSILQCVVSLVYTNKCSDKNHNKLLPCKIIISENEFFNKVSQHCDPLKGGVTQIAV